MSIIVCPRCNSENIKKNGHIHNKKQNHLCKNCEKQFVLNPKQKLITEHTKVIIKKLLLERISLLGICRVTEVSLQWLLQFIVATYNHLPDHLNAKIKPHKKQRNITIYTLEAQADELWSFVGNKDNKQWVWIALDSHTKQVIAFHVGDRSQESAKQLWDKIPETYKLNATFYTDRWDAYISAIPSKQHKPVDKKSGKTSAIERFNCTLRQRVSRLVRSALSFSKKLDNHIGAIKYFICHYNLVQEPLYFVWLHLGIKFSPFL